MQFIINQAITLVVSVALLSSSIDASGGIRGGGGGGGRFLSTTSRTTNVQEGEYCASEGNLCYPFSRGPDPNKKIGQIRYGHSGSNSFSNWQDFTVDNYILCAKSTFGMDPKKNSKKECYVRQKPSEAENKADESIKQCASDGSSCSCVGGQARYGYPAVTPYVIGKGDWTNWIDVQPGAPGVFDTGSINCVKSSFGNFDPAQGKKKACQCRDIPKDIVTIDKYDGFWEKSCENCNSFNYKETFTVTEGTQDSVSEAFMNGWSTTVGATVGYSSGGAEGSATVSSTIQESYQRETTRIITNSRTQSTEISCGVTSCDNGALFRWMIEGQDIKGNAAFVATCNFVCIPNEDQQSTKLEPVCPVSVCNSFENCQCALAPWLSEEAREAGEDEKLCTTAPTSAPTKAPTSAPTKAQVENPDVVVSCAGTKCSDGSDGTSCGRYGGGCCPFLTETNSNNGEDKKCYCGLSHEDAKQNNIPCIATIIS